MRHAKSSWKSDAPSDHLRPLNARGTRDAPRIGLRLLAMGWRPDLVLASDAQRTRLTAEGLFPGVPEPPPIDWEPSFYLGGIDELQERLSREKEAQTILVLGHNPGWEDALTWLSGSQERLTTANAALLRASSPQWSQALSVPHRFELLTIIRPRDMDA